MSKGTGTQSTDPNSRNLSRTYSFPGDLVKIGPPHPHHHQDAAPTSMQTISPQYPVSGKFFELHVPSVQPFHDKFQITVPTIDHDSKPVDHSPKPVDHSPKSVDHDSKAVVHSRHSVDHDSKSFDHSQKSVDRWRKPIDHSRKPDDHHRKSSSHRRKPVDRDSKLVDRYRKSIEHQQRKSLCKMFPLDAHRRKSLEQKHFYRPKSLPPSVPVSPSDSLAEFYSKRPTPMQSAQTLKGILSYPKSFYGLNTSIDSFTQREDVPREGFRDYVQKPAKGTDFEVDIMEDEVSGSEFLDSEAIEAIAKQRIQKAHNETLQSKMVTMKVQNKEELRYALFMRCLRCLLISPFFIVPCTFSSDWTTFEYEEAQPFTRPIKVVFQHGPWRVCPCDANDWLEFGFIKYCKRTITDNACFGEGDEGDSRNAIFASHSTPAGDLTVKIASALTIAFVMMAWLVAFNIYVWHVCCTRDHHSKASKRQVVFFTLCVILACVAGITTVWSWFEQNYKWPGIGFSACFFSVGVLFVIAALAHIVYVGFY